MSVNKKSWNLRIIAENFGKSDQSKSEIRKLSSDCALLSKRSIHCFNF